MKKTAFQGTGSRERSLNITKPVFYSTAAKATPSDPGGSIDTPAERQ
jgi:hypothetical protein